MEFDTQRFPDKGDVPNHPHLPLILYKAAVAPDLADLAATFEALFSSHGWGGLWRNGIYPFHHYHSTAHEVLGIAGGAVTVMLGGEGGLVAELGPGDAVLIPAGVGHKRLSSSHDLLVVGGYPLGQRADLIRADQHVDGAAVRGHIAAVGLPAEDPVGGKDGPIFTAWLLPG